MFTNKLDHIQSDFDTLFFKNFLLILVVAGLFFSCKRKKKKDTAPPTVTVTAKEYQFQGVPDTLKSGWTHFELINKGKEPHFFILDHLPEGKGMDAFMKEIAMPFDSVWYKLRDGKINKKQAGKMLGKKLPKWFGSVERWGGTGIIKSGMTTDVTVNLKPGPYIMECYIKNPEGEFHVSIGMAEEIYVTRDSTSAQPPSADAEITLTNKKIKVEDSLSSGTQTVAVHFKEHPKLGLGNDLHLVRMTDTTHIDSLKKWMDWMEVGGLKPPAPATFLGGTQEMPVGNTSYFTVHLDPGSYAWITETMAANVRVKQFTIEKETAGGTY